VSSEAPVFELPDLTGVRRKLSEFRGRDVLLVFFNPRCGFCTKMAAELAAIPVQPWRDLLAERRICGPLRGA
jgi:peroxiredoxin